MKNLVLEFRKSTSLCCVKQIEGTLISSNRPEIIIERFSIGKDVMLDLIHLTSMVENLMMGEWKSLLSEVGAFSPAALPAPAAWNLSWYLSP